MQRGIAIVLRNVWISSGLDPQRQLINVVGGSSIADIYGQPTYMDEIIKIIEMNDGRCILGKFYKENVVRKQNPNLT
jgi:hypothetical protein